MSPRRVLLVLGPSAGGIRQHVAVLADALEQRGWTVRVAGPSTAPIATTTPSWMATSACRGGEPVPSTRVPLRMTAAGVRDGSP